MHFFLRHPFSSSHFAWTFASLSLFSLKLFTFIFKTNILKQSLYLNSLGFKQSTTYTNTIEPGDLKIPRHTSGNYKQLLQAELPLFTSVQIFSK